MAFEQKWEETHRIKQWGKYPKEELVRYASRNFGNDKISGHKRILDIGCGQGAATWFLAREGFSPVSVDGSRSAITKCRSRLHSEGLEFKGLTCCITQLPFADKSFDAAVDVVSIAHNSFSDIYAIFGEVARVLKPGGKLFSMLPTNKCSRRTFKAYNTTFLERDEVNYMLESNFTNIQILNSSYELEPECRIDTWVVTAEKQERT